MQTRSRGDYTIASRELVAEGTDLRVQVLTLAAGQCVPWHYHTEISDSFVCLDGPMVVETRAPRHVYRLVPGERCAGHPGAATRTGSTSPGTRARRRGQLGGNSRERERDCDAEQAGARGCARRGGRVGGERAQRLARFQIRQPAAGGH